MSKNQIDLEVDAALKNIQESLKKLKDVDPLEEVAPGDELY